MMECRDCQRSAVSHCLSPHLSYSGTAMVVSLCHGRYGGIGQPRLTRCLEASKAGVYLITKRCPRMGRNGKLLANSSEHPEL